MRIEHVRDEKGKHKGYVVHHRYETTHPDGRVEQEAERPAAVHDTADEVAEHVKEQMGPQEEEAQAAPEAGGGAAMAGAGEPA